LKDARFKIGIKIAAAATRCQHSLACLQGGASLCPVEKEVGDQSIFVTCLKEGRCPYQHRFGNSCYLCTCPVRQDIYRKYRQ
jgi:hypothetical protein